MSAQGSKSARVRDRRNRLVVKLGTNLLTNGGETLDIELMSSLVAQIAALMEAVPEVLPVTSGAVAGGRRVVARRPGTEQPRSGDVPWRQVLAPLGSPEWVRTPAQLFRRHVIALAATLRSRLLSPTRRP